MLGQTIALDGLARQRENGRGQYELNDAIHAEQYARIVLEQAIKHKETFCELGVDQYL